MKFAELAQVALLGTERQNISIRPETTALDLLQSQIDANQRERALLSLAALSGLHERIGGLPVRDHAPAPIVCEVEQQPRVGERAGILLRRLLDGDFVELLPEWLALATSAKLLAPPETLPALLSRGTAEAALHETILPVLGKRGRWLAAQNEDWAWVRGAAGDDEKVWQIGEPPARLLFLQRLRRTNPARARELLAGTLKEETPEDRAAFIATLETGLAAEDELFLEAALEDKRKEVRRNAAALLARLPDSALVRRSMERVKPLLKFVSGARGNLLKLQKAKSATIEVTLPAECNKVMQRDSIEPKPPVGIGEKAWWLIQMLETVPLNFWQSEWNTTIDEILTASQQGEWKKELIEAWARAAVRQKNGAWAEALFEIALDQKQPGKFEGLLVAMATSQLETRLAALFSGNNQKIRDHLGTLLGSCHHDWSPAFSRAVLGFMRNTTAQESGDWPLRNQFASFAEHLAPEVLAEAVAGWPTDAKGWEFWSKGVDEFLAVVQFRSDLHATLTLKP